MERSIVAALVLSVFFLLVVYILIVPTYSAESESFVGNTNIIRASLCNCLPGYIPSSTGGLYVCLKLGDPTVTRKCY